MGERRTGDTSEAASMTKGFPAKFFASKESAMGTSTVGNWVAACESVGTLAGGVLEGWHGALCVRRLERQVKKKEQANRLNSHIQSHNLRFGTKMCATSFCHARPD